MSKSTHFKQKRIRAAAHAQPFARDPSYLPNVIKKVKKHRKFKDLSDEAARQKAIELTDHRELHVEFSHLLDEQFENQMSQIQEEAEETDFGQDFISEREREAAKSRAAITLHGACEMPIKLQLSELNRDNLPPRFAMDRFAKLFALKYGPLHAALVVGDVTLEWNDSSLVVPEHGVIEPDIQVDIRASTAAMKSIAKQEPLMEAAINSLDFNRQMDLIYDVTVDRGQMIEALIEVIAKYNKRNVYHIVRRNCQTFVVDAMKAMGINKPPKLTGRLGEYYTELRKGVKKVPEDFQTHEELDRYVRDSQGTGEFAHLTQHDKEFLLCLYFKFHLETLEEDKAEVCQFPGCKKNEVERAIDSPLILEKYFNDGI